MAKEEAEATPELSDSERIAQLETRVGFHRVLVVVLGAMTLILLSSVITGVIVLNSQISKIEVPESGGAGEGESGGGKAPSSMLGKEMLVLKKEVEKQGETLEKFTSVLDTHQTMENIRQVQQLTEILAAQEAAFRSVMGNLRAGMRDLSRMVPGSRTWLEEYEQRMSRSMEGSVERFRKLQEFTEETGEKKDDS